MSKGKSVKELMKSGFKSRFHTDGFSMFEDIPASLKEPDTTIKTSDFQTTGNHTTNPNSLNTADNRHKDTNLSLTNIVETSDNQTTGIRTTNTINNKTTIVQDISVTKEQLPPTARKGISYKGYFPLKCIVFSPELFLVLKSGEFKLLSYLSFLRWRYPEKPGYVRAALPYLEKGTGIGRSAIHEHLKRLIELNFIRCDEVNKKIGNLYFITDTFLWTISDSQTSDFQTTGNQTSEVRKSNDRSLISGLQTSENQTKDLSSFKLSISLNSETLMRLISKLMKKERERALTLLKELNTENSTDLELVFSDVFQNRKDTSGKEIKSEIGYLETCYLKHRDWLKSTITEIDHKKQKQYEIEATHRAKEEKERAEQDEWDRIHQAFLEAFPSEDAQREVIENYSKTMSGLSLSIGSARKSLAISAWFRDNYREA